jgi:hypothetical protein
MVLPPGFFVAMQSFSSTGCGKAPNGKILYCASRAALAELSKDEVAGSPARGLGRRNTEWNCVDEYRKKLWPKTSNNGLERLRILGILFKVPKRVGVV